MNMRITAQLSEMYCGIIAYGRVSSPWFGVIDFAGLAASAVNLLIKRGEISSWEKRECSKYMVERFNQDIGRTMPLSVINEVVNYMDTVTDIDRNLGGIMAAIEMAR
jgi:hypothetical protein